MGMLRILPDERWIRYDVGQRGHNRRILRGMIESDVSVCGLTDSDLTGRQIRADDGVDPTYWQGPEI
jgi:hypothetical protein